MKVKADNCTYRNIAKIKFQKKSNATSNNGHSSVYTWDVKKGWSLLCLYTHRKVIPDHVAG